ncbi:MAG TPA: hypothetical protein VG986_01335 [Pseudolabrys sp.]|nr:hypothetical protein [Pseudolabrys sp.]
MSTERPLAAQPAIPMTAAEIDAFVNRAKAERAVSMRAGALRLGRRLRRLLSRRQIGSGNLPRNGIWASHA